MRPTELEVITGVLDAATRAGWEAFEVNNGGGWERVSSRQEALDAITAADLAEVNLKREDQTTWMFFVLGNEPHEVLADYGVNLSADVEPYIDSIQP